MSCRKSSKLLAGAWLDIFAAQLSKNADGKTPSAAQWAWQSIIIVFQVAVD